MAKKIDLVERARTARRELKDIKFTDHFDPTGEGGWCELLRDILAFANSGGGAILVGLAADGSPSGVDPSQLIATDPAEVTDRIAKYTGVNFAGFKIMRLERYDGSQLAAILITGSEAPIPFTRFGICDLGGGKQKTAFSKGSLYFRHGAKSEPANARDMIKWRDRSIGRARRDWLEGIRKVVSAPVGHTVTVVPSSEHAPATSVVHGSLSAAAKGPKVAVQNAQEIWPYRRKDLLLEANRRLGSEKIREFDVQCANWKLDIVKAHPEFAYRPHKLAAPQYSPAYVDWLVDKFEKDAHFFVRLREEYSEYRRRRKVP